MSDSDSDSDLGDKMDDSTEKIEENKKENSMTNNIPIQNTNIENIPIQTSIAMTNNRFPKDNFQENNIPLTQENSVKKNEDELLDNLEKDLEHGNEIKDNTQNKNEIFKKNNVSEVKENIAFKNEEKGDDKKENEKDDSIELPNLNKEPLNSNSNFGRPNFRNNNNFGTRGRFNNRMNDINNNRENNRNFRDNFRDNNNNFRDNNNNFRENRNFNRRNNFFPNNFNETNFDDNNLNNFVKNKNYDINNDPFYNNNKETIMDIKEVYPDLENIEILKIIKLIHRNDSRTIFEVMNFIRREYIIIITLKEVKNMKDRQYQGISDINEMNYEEDILSFHDDILKKYKTTNNLSSNEWNYKNENDKRRELIKDMNGFYNYLPIINTDNNESKNEIYAKNENEVLYHSLMYKTILCRNKKCSNNLCSYSHNLGEDLRLIYDYQDEKICKLMLKLMKRKILHIEDYLNHFEIPLKFSLNDFKILKCKNGKLCQKDPHLCYCYHSEEEIRRPPKLFRYINKRCDYAQKNEKSFYRPDLCIFGIFCHFLHSKGEFNYHENNFRKRFNCTRKKGNDGNCIFYETCYGKHEKNNANVNVKSDNIILSNSNLDESNNEKNKEILDYENKIKNIENVLKFFFCKKCGVIPNNYLSYVTKCGHIFCHACALQCVKEKKCFKCDSVIEKGSILVMDFGLNKNEK